METNKAYLALRSNQAKNTTSQQTPLSVVPQFVPGITPNAAVKTISEMIPNLDNRFYNMNEQDLKKVKEIQLTNNANELLFANQMREQILGKIAERVEAKEDILEQKINKVWEASELTLPCVLTTADLKE